MAKTVVLETFGGPEVLTLKDIDPGKVGPEQVLIKQKALGLNFIDIRQRRGDTGLSLPAVIGCEACGVIEELGSNVPEFRVGDRVAYATAPFGAYTEARTIDKKYLVPVPDYISDEDAAALLLKGMTAHYLLRRTFFVTQKNTVLVHAAAGGVGQLLCVLGAHYGCKVIAVIRSEEKRAVLEKLGVKYIINRASEDLVKKVMEYTDGKGVHAVYDSVGKDTFEQSLNCLSDFGLMVSYGSASGPAPLLNVSSLGAKSLFVTNAVLFVYKKQREELLLSANEVFSLMQQQILKPNIFKKYKLSDIQEAHRNLESGKTTGQSIIIP